MYAFLWISAAALGALSLGVAAWALLADRSRGRRRCPKCFHAMDAKIGLVCPECGHDAREERRLFHTRRRWKMAIAAVLVFGGMGLALAGLARVQQTGGWKDLPNWAVVRLMPSERGTLDLEVQRRIQHGLFSARQVQAVVDEALRRLQGDAASATSGLSLLTAISRNSVYKTDTPESPRPTLAMLSPPKTTEELLDLARRDATRLSSVINLLGHMKDAHPPALFALIENLKSDDAAAQSNSWQALQMPYYERVTPLPLPEPPTDAMDVMRARRPDQRPLIQSRVETFSEKVTSFHGDTVAAEAWAAERWKQTRADGGPEGIDRLPELWLWCRLDGLGTESRKATVEATASDEVPVAAYAIKVLARYPWSPETGEILRTSISSPEQRIRQAAIEAIFWIGPPARGLTPDLLKQAATLDGIAGGSGFVDSFKALGGDPVALRDAVVERLEKIHTDHLDRVFKDRGGISGGPAYMVVAEFWWLTDIAQPSDRAIAVCEQYMSVGEHMPALSAAIAYAAMTGEREKITRFILSKRPDLTQPFFSDSTQERLLDLLCRRLADPVVLIEYVEQADSVQQRAFIDMLHQFVRDYVVLEDYLPMLRGAASNTNDAVIQTQAEDLLVRYETLRAAGSKTK